MSDLVAEVRELRMRYGTNEVLAGIDFAVRTGEVVALAEAEKLADRVLILAGGAIIADGSPDELALRLSARAEVRWTVDGQRYVHPTEQATKFTRELFAQYGEAVEDLEVRRPSLEDTYMALVQEYEQ